MIAAFDNPTAVAQALDKLTDLAGPDGPCPRLSLLGPRDAMPAFAGLLQRDETPNGAPSDDPMPHAPASGLTGDGILAATGGALARVLSTGDPSPLAPAVQDAIRRQFDQGRVLLCVEVRDHAMETAVCRLLLALGLDGVMLATVPADAIR